MNNDGDRNFERLLDKQITLSNNIYESLYTILSNEKISEKDFSR